MEKKEIEMKKTREKIKKKLRFWTEVGIQSHVRFQNHLYLNIALFVLTGVCHESGYFILLNLHPTPIPNPNNRPK